MTLLRHVMRVLSLVLRALRLIGLSTRMIDHRAAQVYWQVRLYICVKPNKGGKKTAQVAVGCMPWIATPLRLWELMYFALRVTLCFQSNHMLDLIMLWIRFLKRQFSLKAKCTASKPMQTQWYIYISQYKSVSKFSTRDLQVYSVSTWIAVEVSEKHGASAPSRIGQLKATWQVHPETANGATAIVYEHHDMPSMCSVKHTFPRLGKQTWI